MKFAEEGNDKEDNSGGALIQTILDNKSVRIPRQKWNCKRQKKSEEPQFGGAKGTTSSSKVPKT